MRKLNHIDSMFMIEKEAEKIDGMAVPSTAILKSLNQQNNSSHAFLIPSLEKHQSTPSEKTKALSTQKAPEGAKVLFQAH